MGLVLKELTVRKPKDKQMASYTPAQSSYGVSKHLDQLGVRETKNDFFEEPMLRILS